MASRQPQEGEGSQVLAKPLQLVEEEVYVGTGQHGVGHDHAEEVAPGAMGLVADHHGALLHHALLEYRGHLRERQSSAAARARVGKGCSQICLPACPLLSEVALCSDCHLVPAYFLYHIQPAGPSLPSALLFISPIPKKPWQGPSSDSQHYFNCNYKS